MKKRINITIDSELLEECKFIKNMSKYLETCLKRAVANEKKKAPKVETSEAVSEAEQEISKTEEELNAFYDSLVD